MVPRAHGFAIAHIATVGKAMSSSEAVSYPILRKHDVDYVLVIFGGLLGYSGWVDCVLRCSSPSNDPGPPATTSTSSCG